MKYERKGGMYNYYVVVVNKDGWIELVHPMQLKESDNVLFETINKQQWHDFVHYCNVKYHINACAYEGSPSEFKELWNEFNNQ